ncbi:MAG: DUF6765 family protein [bacterium]
MQRDFHFYCIAVLARSAGYNKKDAFTIAYASQYVDDSTESEPIKVDGIMFDPVRTAHKGLIGYITAVGWSAQKRVHIPFHFIPPKPIQSPEDTFVTQPAADFALDILREAAKEPDPGRRLCRIGVALHTLADTWAHREFSGRNNEENDVESIHVKKNGRFKNLLLKNVYLDALPEIGHAEAEHYPDYPNIEWKYTQKKTAKTIHRNNTKEFLLAAERIHAGLQETLPDSQRTDLPQNVKNQIRKLLADPAEDLEERCGKWRSAFQHMFPQMTFEYDRRAWRDKALKPKTKRDTTDWDEVAPSTLETFEFSGKRNFYQSEWVQFHRAALLQRHFVLERLL